MSVSKRVINGEPVWVIDRRFRSAAGEERFRRAAQVQTRAAAEAEEWRVIEHWKEHGSIKQLLIAPTPEKSGESEPSTWDSAFQTFQAVEAPKKKPSTRRGYKRMAEGPGFKRWSGAALLVITRPEIDKWDTDLIKSGIGASTRRNHHILLRSVLKSAKKHGLLEALPEFPCLPYVGEQPIETFSGGDVQLLLTEGANGRVKGCPMKAVRAAQLAFSVAVYAGLRAGEVRALRRRDVDLERRTITVRIALSASEEGTPKSGDSRVIPIAQPLYERLEIRCRDLEPDDHVCVMRNGKPWGEHGMLKALQRACGRLKIEGSRYHALRHFFGTTLVAAGVDIITVKDLLGHNNVSVTQRYAHYESKRARAAIAVFETASKLNVPTPTSVSTS